MHAIIVSEKIVNGQTIQVRMMRDIDPDMTPRDGVNLGVMLTGHRRYSTLGDEQVDPDTGTIDTEVDCERCEGSGDASGRECPDCEGSGAITLDFHTYLRTVYGARVVLPLGLLDHSGISLYVGEGAHPLDGGGWDSGQVGVIYDTQASRDILFGDEEPTLAEIEKELRGEVDIYDRFLRGEMYEYVVIDGTRADADFDEDAIVDACSGFYSEADALEQAGLCVAA